MKKIVRLIFVCVAICLSMTAIFSMVGCSDDKRPTPKSYTVTLPTGLTGGTVTSDKTAVEENKDVKITATASNGYELEWLKINDAAQTISADGIFTVKGVKSNIVVTAGFKAIIVKEFATFPEDRVVDTDVETLTYYINSSGSQEFRNALPTVADATITSKATVKNLKASVFLNDGITVPGTVVTNYDGAGFTNGVLADISGGIVMKNGFSFEIEYTATFTDGVKLTKVQTIIVYKLVDKMSATYSDLFTGAELTSGLSLIDAPSAIMLGTKALKLACPAGTAEKHGFYDRADTFIGTNKATQRFEMFMYNNSESDVTIAVKAAAWISDFTIPAKSYIMWEPYNVAPAYHEHLWTHGFISEEGYLNQVQFTLVPKLGESAEVFISEFLSTPILKG